MRAPVLALLAIVLAACPASNETLGLGDDDRGGQGSGSGAGGMAPGECSVDVDCVPAALKCCDCPTYAVPATDPAEMACADVDCAPASCGSPMQAACDQGQCVLECAPVACADAACPDGFATDANGCLTCECAAVANLGECAVDTDCVRVRDDCCGCEGGGFDTSVPAGQEAAHDAALMCPANPSCPGVDTCSPDLAPRCVQGSCELVEGTLPANACGRADLPACPTGEVCYVNASDQATMRGVGVCQP